MYYIYYIFHWISQTLDSIHSMCTTYQIFHWTERPWTSLYVYYTHSVFRCLSGMWSTVFMRINIKKVKTKKMFLCQHPEVMSGTTVTRTLSHEMEVGKIITATIQSTEGCNLIWFDFDLNLIWYTLTIMIRPRPEAGRCQRVFIKVWLLAGLLVNDIIKYCPRSALAGDGV